MKKIVDEIVKYNGITIEKSGEALEDLIQELRLSLAVADYIDIAQTCLKVIAAALSADNAQRIADDIELMMEDK